MKLIFVLAFLVATVVLSCSGFEKGISYDSQAYEMPLSKCRHKKICTHKGLHYPQDAINIILKRYPPLQYRYRSDENYESRVSDGPRISECKSDNIKSKPIYFIKDKHDVTRVVVQSDLKKREVKQNPDIRWCVKEGPTTETQNFHSNDLKHVNMTCNNVMADLDFMVLTLDHSDIEIISVESPVFCKARYSKLP